MKQPLFVIALIFSGLSMNAQNLTNQNVQTVAINYVNNNGYNQQMTTNYNYSNDMNPSYEQFASNNVDIQVQSTNRNRGNSSAMQSLGNSNNDLPNTNKQKVQTSVNNVATQNVDNVTNNNENFRPFRGNVFQTNQNVLDNNVGNENANRGRGGNIVVDDNNDHVQSNPVINDNKKTVASKPVVKEYQGLDFKPSGLSGRDYSNGGKLKKGQKNFYTPHPTKHKTIHKKKPSYKKAKHHTSKCAKW
jgi:hypothetical protein